MQDRDGGEQQLQGNVQEVDIELEAEDEGAPQHSASHRIAIAAAHVVCRS